MAKDKCPMCKKRGQTWSGGAPICAFPDGKFTTSNWNCATANALRELASEDEWVGDQRPLGTWWWRDDMSAASFGAIWIPENDLVRGYVVMSWYKGHGNTGQIWLMCDDYEPRPLTLEEAQATLKAVTEYRREHGKEAERHSS